MIQTNIKHGEEGKIWRCPKCGKNNSNLNHYCENCGSSSLKKSKNDAEQGIESSEKSFTGVNLFLSICVLVWIFGSYLFYQKFGRLPGGRGTSNAGGFTELGLIFLASILFVGVIWLLIKLIFVKNRKEMVLLVIEKIWFFIKSAFSQN